MPLQKITLKHPAPGAVLGVAAFALQTGQRTQRRPGRLVFGLAASLVLGRPLVAIAASVVGKGLIRQSRWARRDPRGAIGVAVGRGLAFGACWGRFGFCCLCFCFFFFVCVV